MNKPGWKTTEFWLTVAVQIAAILAALGGMLPPEKAAVAMAISQGIYSIARSMAKAPGAVGLETPRLPSEPAAAPPPAKLPLPLLIIVPFVVMSLTGCNPAASEQFRARVESVSVGAQATKEGASGNLTFTLRDPRQTGLAK